jgi:AbrB family looped-hinge helix DNA binding protein
MWKEATISPKGQLTLPKEIRDALAIEPGDTIIVTVAENRLILTPKNVDFNELAGFLGEPPKGHATLEEIDETVAKEAGRDASEPIKAAKDQAA